MTFVTSQLIRTQIVLVILLWTFGCADKSSGSEEDSSTETGIESFSTDSDTNSTMEDTASSSIESTDTHTTKEPDSSSESDSNGGIIGTDDTDSGQKPQITETAKARVIIMSDIGGAEPDDQESFVRFLLYSNEIDIVGLIGANSQFGHDRGDTEVFRSIIEVYDSIRPNLLQHAQGWPTANTLLAGIKTGQREKYGMEGVGQGNTTDGSSHILTQLKNDDPRPLWVLAWGGTSTLAQALWELQNDSTINEQERDALVKKLRIYDIAGQDDTGAWIAHTFYPNVFYIRSVNQFLSFSKRSSVYTPGEEAQGDLSVVDANWFTSNVINSHGDYGKKYPMAQYMFEGDTPSFLYLVQNGLGSPDNPNFGSWGGRFTKEPKSDAGRYSGTENTEYLEGHGAPMYTDATDTYIFSGDNTTYTTLYTPLWRWRFAYQNDFAVRMDWSTTDKPSEANHTPQIVLNGIEGKSIVEVDAAPGMELAFNANNTSDPDGNNLHFQWGNYMEPGSISNEITIKNSDLSEVSVLVPQTALIGDTIHIILSVSDDGNPSLTAYRRIIINVI